MSAGNSAATTYLIDGNTVSKFVAAGPHSVRFLTQYLRSGLAIAEATLTENDNIARDLLHVTAEQREAAISLLQATANEPFGAALASRLVDGPRTRRALGRGTEFSLTDENILALADARGLGVASENEDLRRRAQNDGRQVADALGLLIGWVASDGHPVPAYQAFREFLAAEGRANVSYEWFAKTCLDMAEHVPHLRVDIRRPPTESLNFGDIRIAPVLDSLRIGAMPDEQLSRDEMDAVRRAASRIVDYSTWAGELGDVSLHPVLEREGTYVAIAPTAEGNVGFVVSPLDNLLLVSHAVRFGELTPEQLRVPSARPFNVQQLLRNALATMDHARAQLESDRNQQPEFPERLKKFVAAEYREFEPPDSYDFRSLPRANQGRTTVELPQADRNAIDELVALLDLAEDDVVLRLAAFGFDEIAKRYETTGRVEWLPEPYEETAETMVPTDLDLRDAIARAADLYRSKHVDSREPQQQPLAFATAVSLGIRRVHNDIAAMLDAPLGRLSAFSDGSFRSNHERITVADPRPAEPAPQPAPLSATAYLRQVAGGGTPTPTTPVRANRDRGVLVEPAVPTVPLSEARTSIVDAVRAVVAATNPQERAAAAERASSAWDTLSTDLLDAMGRGDDKAVDEITQRLEPIGGQLATEERRTALLERLSTGVERLLDVIDRYNGARERLEASSTPALPEQTLD